MSKRVRKTFEHPSGVVVRTGLPVEQNRLRAQGFVERSARKAVPVPETVKSESK